jgi:hypothetical protein
MDVRMIDLSMTGARIEHREPLPAGLTCAFEFPPSLGSLVVSVRVVHSRVIATESGYGEEPHPRYQSGLEFVEIKGDQRALLTGIVERLVDRGAEGEGRVLL